MFYTLLLLLHEVRHRRERKTEGKRGQKERVWQTEGQIKRERKKHNIRETRQRQESEMEQRHIMSSKIYRCPTVFEIQRTNKRRRDKERDRRTSSCKWKRLLVFHPDRSWVPVPSSKKKWLKTLLEEPYQRNVNQQITPQLNLSICTIACIYRFVKLAIAVHTNNNIT